MSRQATARHILGSAAPPHIFPASHQLSTLLGQLVGTELRRLGRVARDAENFAPKFHRQPRGDERSPRLRPPERRCPQRDSRDNPVAYRKILRLGKRPNRKPADDWASLVHFRKNPLTLFRIRQRVITRPGRPNPFPASEPFDSPQWSDDALPGSKLNFGPEVQRFQTHTAKSVDHK